MHGDLKVMVTRRFSLLCTFNSAGICFEVFFRRKANKSLTQMWNLWLAIMDRQHDITHHWCNYGLNITRIANIFLTWLSSFSLLTLFVTLMLSGVTKQEILICTDSHLYQTRMATQKLYLLHHCTAISSSFLLAKSYILI